MTARLFSILRRKPGIIDLITPLKPLSSGVAGYRLKTDTNPFGSFSTTVISTGRTGFVDSAVAGPHNVIQPGENVRVIIKPSNYGLSDTDYFWLKLVYLDESNAELPSPGAATLVLPTYVGPAMTGFTASAITSVTQIDLPRAMSNFRVLNLDTTNALGLILQEGGPEITIPAGKDISGFDGTVSSIWVRGIVGTVQFSASFTYAFPR